MRSKLKTVGVFIAALAIVCGGYVFLANNSSTDENNVYAEEGTENILSSPKVLSLKIDDPIMKVNGTDTEIDPEGGTAPVIVSGRTLVPIRAIIENMGGTVEWNNETRESVLTYGEDVIRLVIDSQTAYLNDTESTLDTAPTIINGRTMLPIRFIAESFGFEVDWNSDEQTITITKESEQPTEKASTEAVTETTALEEASVESDSNALVAYFSATGNTKGVAEKIAKEAGADIFEIAPAVPYTDEDLNYGNDDSRTTKEQNDDSARPEISDKVKNMEQYNVVFIGYPIWWGQAPKIMYTFLESYDFEGKTIIPFCTSGSSPIGSSAENMQGLTGGADWLEGQRFSGGASEDEVSSWVNSLGLK